MRKIGIVVVSVLLLGAAGCSVIGPTTIRRDRRDYADAISDSWKSQMLLNMVKLRYGDSPMFLDVINVTGGYNVNGSGDFSFNWAPGVNSPTLGFTGSYADNPSITYAPMAGEKFARNLMVPIPAPNLFRLVQAGFPIDMVLRACVVSINGVRNHYAGLSHYRLADDEFFAVCGQLRRLQDDGALELRFNKPEEGKKPSPSQGFIRRIISRIMEFIRHIMSPLMGEKTDDKQKSDAGSSGSKNPPMYICIKEDKAKSKIAPMLEALHLEPPQPEYGYEVIDGMGGKHSGKYDRIGITTQSVLGVIVDFAASYIKVPKSHVLEELVREDFKDTAPNAPAGPLLCVNAVKQKKRPSDAFVAVWYKGYWFYIDDHDFNSKRTFTFLMFLLSLTETESQYKQPILTIPVR